MAKYLKKYKTREDFEEKKESLRYDSRLFENAVCWLEEPDEIEIISRDDRHIFIKYILKSKVMAGKMAFFSSTPKFKEISINGEIFTDPEHLTERDWEAGEYFIIITPKADFEFNGWFKDNKNIIEILYSNQCGVTNIERNAFYWCTNLSSVTIPEKVISIGDYAFYGCSSLASITIPESVTSIGNIAFRNCTSLTSITLPGGITYMGFEAFRDCSNLTSVTFSEGITNIGTKVFDNCTSLTSIVIPNTVTSIGAHAFVACSNLSSITIPESVVDVGVEAFAGTAWYNNQDYGEVYVGKVFYKYKYDTTKPSYVKITVVIKDGTVSISGQAFRDTYYYPASPLRTIYIPKSIRKIDYGVFEYCSLDSIRIEDLAAWCNIDFGDGYSSPLNWSNSLYLNGKLITELIIPDTVNTIKKFTFYKYGKLTRVYIPKSVTSIGNNAFDSCRNLATIISCSITAPQISSNTFTGVGTSSTQQKTLYVPKGSTGYTEGYWLNLCNNNGFTLVELEEEELDNLINQ